MIRLLTFLSVISIGSVAFAQDHEGHHERHGAQEHGADHQVNHEVPADHSDHVKENKEIKQETAALLSRTPEINAALEAGGEAVVVEVLGAVCDFCAKAMNKTFGRREEVAATYVDLDAKTLNLVLVEQGAMSDETIKEMVKKAGYKSKMIYRGATLVKEEAHAVDPA